MTEDLLGFIAMVLLAIAAMALLFFLGLIVLPALAVGAGVMYYVNNHHLPRKRQRDQADTLSRLYRAADAITPRFEELIEELVARGVRDDVVFETAHQLYRAEGLEPPEPLGAIEDQITFARHQMEMQEYVSKNSKQHYRKFADHLVDVLASLQSTKKDGLFQVRRARTPKEIQDLIFSFVNDDGVFQPLITQLDRNLDEQRNVLPADTKVPNYAWAYLKDTPLMKFEYVEGSVSLQNRMYHTYLLGSSGSGKTSLIENIIAHDLTSEEDCCVVVIDSQTQLCEKLAKLDIEDTTYISPKFDLALNLFDVGYAEMKKQGIEGETLINKTVGLLSFVMEGMMSGEFTNPQRTVFQYAIQLVISIPGGNIFTFMEILSDDGHLNYATQIDQFDDNTKRFFMQDFGSDAYKRSREAIRRRLDSLMLNPTFRRLFSARENRIDMFEQLARQRLILIDTNKPMLDDVASAFFGRLFIAMILRASHMRFDGGRSMRPVYLIVDEAHEYFDRSIADMLEQARKANIGLIVAHQSISQAKNRGRDNISDPLMVNTGTKIVWTSYRDDAAKFAGSMQIPTETILNLPQYTFGMYSRQTGFLPIRGVPDALQKLPQRENSYELKSKMEALYGKREQPVEPLKQASPDGPKGGAEPSAPDTQKQDNIHLPPDPDMI